jgi:hypothetical protein
VPGFQNHKKRTLTQHQHEQQLPRHNHNNTACTITTTTAGPRTVNRPGARGGGEGTDGSGRAARTPKPLRPGLAAAML